MKKFLAVMLVLVMALSLCACGGDAEETTPTTVDTTPVVTDPIVTEPVVTEPVTQEGYIVKVVDEGGNPLAGVMVQICKDSCIPGRTDDNGVAVFAVAEDDYKASVLSMPEGYAYAGDAEEIYFDGAMEVTIVLKAVA